MSWRRIGPANLCCCDTLERQGSTVWRPSLTHWLSLQSCLAQRNCSTITLTARRRLGLISRVFVGGRCCHFKNSTHRNSSSSTLYWQIHTVFIGYSNRQPPGSILCSSSVKHQGEAAHHMTHRDADEPLNPIRGGFAAEMNLLKFKLKNLTSDLIILNIWLKEWRGKSENNCEWPDWEEHVVQGHWQTGQPSVETVQLRSIVKLCVCVCVCFSKL